MTVPDYSHAIQQLRSEVSTLLAWRRTDDIGGRAIAARRARIRSCIAAIRLLKRPCLGTMPGVMNACCGHGRLVDTYVQLLDGSCLRGQAAAEFIANPPEATP